MIFFWLRLLARCPAVLLCFIFCYPVSGQVNWQDKVAPEREFDFGIVQQGADAKTVFGVKNPGKKSLSIHSVTSSCGCFSVSFPDKQIGPGERMLMTLVADTKKFSGSKRASMTLRFENPLREIQLNAQVDIRSFDLQPKKLVLESSSEKDSKVEFSIVYPKKNCPQLEAVKSSSEDIEVKIVEKINSDDKVIFKITARKTPSIGQACEGRQWLYLIFEDRPKVVEQIPIIVMADAQSVSWSPKQLVFSLEEFKQGTSKKIIVKFDEPQVLESARIDNELFCLNSTKKLNRRVYVFEVTPTKPSLRGETSRLLIKLDCGEPIEIPILLKE